MNRGIVNNWNAVVRPEDHVYITGDVCMGRLNESVQYIKQLNGTKFLIAGNHDVKARKDEEFRKQFAWIKDYFELSVPDGKRKQRIIMSHYPMLSWHGMGKGSIMVHGHCHNNLPLDPEAKRIDVGLDAQKYYPMDYPSLKKLADTLGFKAVDHHEQK
jgi:calcineurin-like phosphoesterase family protein